MTPSLVRAGLLTLIVASLSKSRTNNSI